MHDLVQLGGIIEKCSWAPFFAKHSGPYAYIHIRSIIIYIYIYIERERESRFCLFIIFVFVLPAYFLEVDLWCIALHCGITVSGTTRE